MFYQNKRVNQVRGTKGATGAGDLTEEKKKKSLLREVTKRDPRKTAVHKSWRTAPPYWSRAETLEEGFSGR